jgi:hypothetical protein
MVQNQLSVIINTAIPIILIVVFIAFIIWKFGEPLNKLWGFIKGLFASSKEKTVEMYQSQKEIVYDI